MTPSQRFAALPTLSLLASIAACASSQSTAHSDPHGRLNAHGQVGGSDYSIVPNGCIQGLQAGFQGAVFTSNAAGALAAVRIGDEPGVGPHLRVTRLVNGAGVVADYDRSQCTGLDLQMRRTGWTVNGVVQLDVTAQIDCTGADGVNVAGTVHFGHCGATADAVRVLETLSSTPTPADTARLAALPRIPQHSDRPALPAALGGISVRVVGHLRGAVVGNETVQAGEQVCATGFERMLLDAGWTIVRDPRAPVDLVADVYCTGHVSWSDHAGLIEIQSPAAGPQDANVSVRFAHEGNVVESIPPGPTDVVCEASGSRDDRFRECAARSEQAAVARILAAIAASQPLATFANQRHASGSHGRSPATAPAASVPAH